MNDYQQLKALHHSLPAFAPIIPTSFLPYLAAFTLIPTFALAFYFSTLPKRTLPIWKQQSLQWPAYSAASAL